MNIRFRLSNALPKQLLALIWPIEDLRHSWGGSPAYYGDADIAFILNNAIQSVSLSYSRSNCYSNGCDCSKVPKNTILPLDFNYFEFAIVDEWAYRAPYPVVITPTANWGHQYESNWQCYNAISVGNVKHTGQGHFEQPSGVTQVCSPSEGASQSRNPKNRYGGPAFRAADSYYPYPSGDREMPYIVVPGITPDAGNIPMHDNCIPGNISLPRSNMWSGTSYSAPTANGIAAGIISANWRMIGWPEKVRAAMILTAENVINGDWNTNYGGFDGTDGAGVVSGANAVWFAKNHSNALPGASTGIEHGMHVASLYWDAVFSSTINFKAKVPSPKPAGKHFRAVLTWDSNPGRPTPYTYDNRLTDLDLDIYHTGTIMGSHSWNGNVEVVDIPATSLTSGATIDVKINKVINRIPSEKFLYYCIAWTWVKDHAD